MTNNKVNTNQLPVVTTIGATGFDTNIPTEQAVREEITAHDEYIYIFGSDVDGATVPAGATRYMKPWGAAMSTNNYGSTFPKACVLSNLFIKTLDAQPAGQDLVITVKENGVATGITITIAGSEAAGTFTDATHTFNFTAGRGIRFDLVQGAGASPSAQIGFITLKGTLHAQ